MKIEKNIINGWLNLYKPKGLSSNKALSEIKKIFNPQKVGFAGTLDPLAEGVLPIAFGEATRLIEYMENNGKAYTFKVIFGIATSTDDMEGEIINKSEKIPSEKEIINVLPYFQGEIEQVPPAFSAVKINGERAYNLARKGVDFTITPKKVFINSLNFKGFTNKNEAEFKVECSKGFYVRSLARDIAFKIGTFGHVSELKRIKSGFFSINNTILLENLKKLKYKEAESFILNIRTVLSDISELALNQDEASRIKNGQSINTNIDSQNKKIQAVLGDKLIAICNAHNGSLKPEKVFNL